VVSSTPWPHFTPGKDTVPILHEAGWAPGPGWMGGISRPHRDSIPDRPACSQSLYRLRYPAHTTAIYFYEIQYWNITELRRLFAILVKNGKQMTSYVKIFLQLWVCNVLIFFIVNNFRIQYVQNITTSNC